MSNYYFKNSSDDLTFHESGGTKITSIRDLGSNINDLSGQTSTKASTATTVTGTGALGGGGNLSANRTITHNTTSLGSGTTSPSAAQTPAFGATFNVPVLSYDQYGHVTGSTTTTVKIPSSAASWTNDHRRVFYGTCTNNADQVKTVTLSNTAGWELVAGTIVCVKFSANNTFTSTTANPIKLNVNSSGDKEIYYAGNRSGAANTGTSINIYGYGNRPIFYMYDGTYWVWMGINYMDGDTVGYNLRFGSNIYKAGKDIYRYMLLLTKDDTNLIPVNSNSNVTAGTKTITTDEFNPFGKILYHNATATTTSGSAISGDRIWDRTNINLSYSFNTTNTLTQYKDVYMVAQMQSNGKAKLYSTPITQTLPSTEDGRIYIYLGKASNNTNLQLYDQHPIFYYHDGQIRLFTNDSHNSSTITKMGGYSLPSSGSSIATGDTLNQAIGKLECRTNDLSGQTETIAAALVTLDETKANADDLGGIKIRKISQSDYDALVNQGTVDPNTLYVVS